MNTIVLIYEEIPEKTTIAILSEEDLANADLTREDLRSVVGMIVNSDILSENQQNVMDKIGSALQGSYLPDVAPGCWHKCVMDHLKPIETGAALIIWCGFAL